MISNKRTIVISTVVIAVAIVMFTSGPLVATHQAEAQILTCEGIDACDVNHATGNPHPTAIPPDPNPGTSEKGNPHNSQSRSGKPTNSITSSIEYCFCEAQYLTDSSPRLLLK